jgi:hypothetical protein
LLESSFTSAVLVSIRPSAGSPEISSGTISAAEPTRGISLTATIAPLIENGLRPTPRRESLAISVAQGSRTSGSATSRSSSSAAASTSPEYHSARPRMELASVPSIPLRRVATLAYSKRDSATRAAKIRISGRC